jgi:hypothetical protein
MVVDLTTDVSVSSWAPDAELRRRPELLELKAELETSQLNKDEVEVWETREQPLSAAVVEDVSMLEQLGSV